MDDRSVIKIAGELERIERRVDIGDYKSKEFWQVVARIKVSGERAKLAEWVGRIDKKIFEKKTRVRVGVTTGNFFEIAGAAFGFYLIFLGRRAAAEVAGAYVLVAAFILSATLHPLAHYFVGRKAGINFLFYFPDGPAKIEPTIKIDYASYLRAEPLARAVMHAAGPVATTFAALLCLAVGFYINVAYWAKLALVFYLLLILGTEMFMSTRSGDLKRVIREGKLIKFKY